MKIFILMLSILLVSNMASANGAKEAVKVCESMTYGDMQERCLEVVAYYKSFDKKAVQICKNMYFDDDKEDCILTIAAKTYNQNEIKECRKKDFDTHKNNCLREKGL